MADDRYNLLPITPKVCGPVGFPDTCKEVGIGYIRATLRFKFEKIRKQN